MKWLLTGLLAGLAVANRLQPLTSDRKPVPPEQTLNHTRQFAPDDFHANVMASFEPSKIITSSHFNSTDFWTSLSPEERANGTFYLNDTRTFITMENPTEVLVGDNSLEGRQTQCGVYGSSKFLAGHSYWSPWEHMTNCLSTYGGAGGSLYYATEVSIGTSYSAGLGVNWGKFLTLNFGYEVSETHSIATGFYCNLNANDMGQVWGRHLMAWALISATTCNCNGVCNTKVGWVDSPAGGDGAWQQFGCSTISGGSQLRCS